MNDPRVTAPFDLNEARPEDFEFHATEGIGHPMDPAYRIGFRPVRIRGALVPTSYTGSVVEVRETTGVYFIVVPHGIQWDSPSIVVDSRTEADRRLLEDLRKFIKSRGSEHEG